jgi:ribosomal protein S18 acetylase RimI-like enzyme
LPPYRIARLDASHEAQLQGLLEAAADYNLLVNGMPPAPTVATKLLVDLPAGKQLQDIGLFGVFAEADELIGVLDWVREYPHPGDWFIGWLLFVPAYRGLGLGGRLYLAFEAWAARQVVENILLEVVEQNRRAFRFWQRLGFRQVERYERLIGEKVNQIAVLRRSLKQ